MRRIASRPFLPDDQDVLFGAHHKVGSLPRRYFNRSIHRASNARWLRPSCHASWVAKRVSGSDRMNELLVNRIRQCPSLPSLPSIAIQVLDLAQRPEADISEIARVISKDPALATKILRTVNSSFYGRSQHVSTVSHALVILGLQSVKTLVLGFSLVSNLSKTKEIGRASCREEAEEARAAG